MSSFSPFSKEELLPQAEMLEIKKQKRRIVYWSYPKKPI